MSVRNFKKSKPAAPRQYDPELLKKYTPAQIDELERNLQTYSYVIKKVALEIWLR
jgi:Tfp pilus assembly PilM family ATPase